MTPYIAVLDIRKNDVFKTQLTLHIDDAKSKGDAERQACAKASQYIAQQGKEYATGYRLIVCAKTSAYSPATKTLLAASDTALPPPEKKPLDMSVFADCQGGTYKDILEFKEDTVLSITPSYFTTHGRW